MKYYRVDYKVADAEMVAGEKPYDTIKCTIDPVLEAENADEAIEVALDYLFEQIDPGEHKEIDHDKQELSIYDDYPEDGGKVIEQYWGFEAVEVDENGNRIEDED